MTAVILHIIVATVVLTILDQWRRRIIRDRNLIRAAELFDKTDGRELRAIRQGYERMIKTEDGNPSSEVGEVEQSLMPWIEYSGKWAPVARVFVGKSCPTVATLVLKTDLDDFKRDYPRVDGFEVVFRPFAKPVANNLVGKGHFRLWLPAPLAVDKGKDGESGRNDRTEC